MRHHRRNTCSAYLHRNIGRFLNARGLAIGEQRPFPVAVARETLDGHQTEEAHAPAV
jgi:hypothetical protein